MKLLELLNELKGKLMIDEELKAYLFEDRIEIIDYMSPIKEVGLKEMYGYVLSIYVDNNIITVVEPVAFKLITRANKDLFSYFSSLINTNISDYDSYKKLKDKKKLNYKKLNCTTV